MKVSRQEIERSIGETTFFSGIKDDSNALSFLADRVSTKRFVEGCTIIREGEIGDTLFIVFHGEVRIVKRTMAGEDYTVVTLSHREKACIGELALFDSDKRSATVIAETNCDVLILSRDAFHEFADQYPKQAIMIYRQIASTMSGRLRRANQDIVTLFEALVREIEGDA